MRTLLPFPIHQLMSAVLLCSLLAIFNACQPTGSSSEGEAAEAEEVIPNDTPPEADLNGDSLRGRQSSRGLDMATARITDFSLKDYFPNLYTLVEGDAEMTRELEVYAKQIMTREGLESEEDLIRLFTQREEVIIPHLQPFFENMDNNVFYEQFKILEGELNQIGLTLQTAEAMFIGLGPTAVLESDIERLGSEAYRLYLAFQNADAQARQGEYPYLNMEPFQEMIVLGEQLKSLVPNPYVEKIEERYEEVLLAFTDVHLVRQATAREDEKGAPMVGGVHTDFYPYATETETLSEFAETQSQSSFSEVMRKISENMSEISDNPESVYVIVTEWANDEEMAQSRVVSHLNAGEDIPHYLKIRRGDGTDRYAVAYRFYEDEEKANAAFEKIENTYPDARLVYCSVKNQELYQLGPSAD